MRSDQVSNSRYNKGGVSSVTGNKLDWWERVIIPKSSTDMNIKLDPKYHNRPDILAYDLYGKSSLMWVILQYNSILDVTTEFVSGVNIIAPTRIRLFQDILSTTITRSNIVI